MRSSVLAPLLVGLVATLSACSDDRAGDSASDPLRRDGVPPPPSALLCDRLEGAEPSAVDPAVQLSRTYALARWFAIPRPDNVDQALLNAAGAPSPVGMLDAFAGEIGACVVPNGASLGTASTRKVGDVVVVRPGIGSVELPATARAIAVDLRGLSSGPELAAVLAALLPSLGGEHAWPSAEEVRCAGMPDEIFAPGTSLYSCDVAEDMVLPVTTSTAPERPLAVITGPRLAPEAALFAASLRLARKAWLVGEDVLAEVAENTAASGPSRSAFVRTHVLRQDGVIFPDVVPADHRTADPNAWLRSLPQRGAPPELAPVAITRPATVTAPPPSSVSAVRTDRVGTRAALVAAHAAARTFFPYFQTIPDTWDAALVDVLPGADGVAGPRDQVALLRRMGVALEDGHQFVPSAAPAAHPAGYARLDVDVVGDDVIVTASAEPGIARGDRIVSIGGAPVAELFGQQMSRTSGSPGRRRNSSAFGLLELDRRTTFVVEAAAGAVRTVNVGPSSQSVALTAWERSAGPLDDLGAPDVFYVSLSGPALRGADVATIVAEAKRHRALILDLRGYPGFESYAVVGGVLPPSAVGCELRIPTVSRRGEIERDLLQQTVSDFGGSGDEPFSGPMAVLVGPTTHSAAEHLAFFFANGRHARLVGRPTSGANGNITGAWLPAGLGFSFTGMEVRHPGGGRFHGLGLQPDVVVAPTRADIADGTDTVLVRAIAAVSP